MNDYKRRKELYKTPKGNIHHWKDAYRKKCFESLRARRASLIEKFRCSNSPTRDIINDSDSPTKLVYDVMENEWNAINSSRKFPSLNRTDPSSKSSMNSEDEVMMGILLEIQDELQTEGEAMLNEFLSYDTKGLEAIVEMYQNEEVICPVCQKRKLREIENRNAFFNNCFRTPQRAVAASGTFAFHSPSDSLPEQSRSPQHPLCSPARSCCLVSCECGLLLSGKNVSLQKLQTTIQNTLKDHEKNCSASLTFTRTDDVSGMNVLITCSSCDWMSLLI